MTSFRAALTGIPEDVQAAVDRDLEAARRGPGALDRALANAPHDQLLLRYKAFCTRAVVAELTAGPAARRAFLAAEAADEQHQIHRGGNR